MTVSLTNAESKVLGNGSTTVWALGFEVADEDELEVVRWFADGTSSALVLNVDYSVSDVGNELGSSITYPLSGSPLPPGQYLYIRRRTGLSQQLLGGAGNDLDSGAVAGQFDRVAMQIQELNAEMKRALKLATIAAPAFPPTANAFFGTDANGNPIMRSDTPTTLTVISGAIVWETTTVAALEADTDLGYSGGSTVVVAAGDLVRAAGFLYQVLDSGAASPDLTTAGGVKLQVMTNESAAFASTITAASLGKFFTRAGALGRGILSAVASTVNSISTSISNADIRGFLAAKLTRSASAVNLLTLNNTTGITLDSLWLTGGWSVNGNEGHGLVAISPNMLNVRSLVTEDFGGLESGNGGAGFLSYSQDGITPYERLRLSDSTFLGTPASEKSFGYVIANAKYAITYGNIAANTTHFGQEFKNNSQYCIMANGVSSNCTYSFGLGFEGVQSAQNNLFVGLVSANSDIGLLWAQASQNLLVGMVADADTAPNHFGDGNVYGLHIEVNSHENVAIGLLASGTAMDFPARIRGSRNVVQLADYSSAARTVTLNAGAQENYVEILHIGTKAHNIKGLIEDQNSPIITAGNGANVYDSPLTREYYGSTQDAFTWGLNGLGDTYRHFSTTGFRFEGKGGQTVLGLGVASTKEAGIRIGTSLVGDEGAFTYQLSATPYWRWDVDETQVMRLDTQALTPVTDQALDLGKSSLPWGDAFIGGLRMRPASVSPPMNNGDLTILVASNTQIEIRYKGTDGVTRSTTLTLS